MKVLFISYKTILIKNKFRKLENSEWHIRDLVTCLSVHLNAVSNDYIGIILLAKLKMNEWLSQL